VPERRGLHGQSDYHLKLSVSVTALSVLIGFVDDQQSGPFGRDRDIGLKLANRSTKEEFSRD
jgi:hypothetical protein